MTGSLGQDWASYQDYTPNTSGLTFAWVKQTEGLTYANPRAASQVATARAKGLVVGHYHYPHMANNPATEADRFLAVAKPQPGDLLCLDWEGYDASNKGVSWSRQVTYKQAFLARLKTSAPTHQHVVYANVDYVNRDPKGTYGDALWVATAGKPAGAPGITHPWLFHQHSTAGGIDHDYCSLTPAQLKAWAHAKETDVALTPAEIDAIATGVWSYKNTKVGDDHDMHQALVNAEANSATAAGGVAIHEGDTPLTDAQVVQIADRLGANATFTAALAAALGKDIAARMQS